MGGVEDERVAVSFGFWLEVEDERVYRDCLLLRIFLDFQSNFMGRLADVGKCFAGGMGHGWSVVGVSVWPWLWLFVSVLRLWNGVRG